MKTIRLFDCLTETQKKQGKLRGMISAAIENKRYELGLTQKDMAARLGVTQSMISKLESSENNITVDKLVELFEELDIKYSISIDRKIAAKNTTTVLKGIEYQTAGMGFGHSIAPVPAADSTSLIA